MRHRLLGFLALPLVATAANAEWREASSDHFVVYSEQDESIVRRFSERLERFHAAMAHVHAKQQAKPSPSNRVTIFVVPSTTQVAKVTDIRRAAGVYRARAGASVAVIPEVRGGSTSRLTGETVLYHEYAHHFMYGLTTRALPRWFTEGFAEFFAGVRFNDDGSVTLGAPANHLALELIYATKVPIGTLLDFDGGYRKERLGRDQFYAQSWMLFHYLQMGQERAGQLVQYQRQMASGASALEAAQSAFGDLEELERNSVAYAKRRKLSAMVIPATALAASSIVMRELRPGEAAMMPTMIESSWGVDREEALSLVPQARKVAVRHPDDPAVLAALAEAEVDAGNFDAAIVAADAALELDARHLKALVWKGYALGRKIESGALSKESWADVRALFIKANAVENDAPVPLIEFYRSYLGQGEQPTKNAVEGLEWAMALAPFDQSLRWLVAQQMVRDNRLQEAVRTLGPLAYSPHPGEQTEAALKLLAEVEAKLNAGRQTAQLAPAQ
jgi:tetratricopeptide (TPR) repeat protein